MDNNSNSYFYLGGLISFLILLLVFAFFSYTLFSLDINRSYVLLKDKTVSISLVSETAPENIEKKIDDVQAVEMSKDVGADQSQIPDIITPSKQVEQIEQTQKAKKTQKVDKQDVSKLFSHVVTKNIEMKKVENSQVIDEKKLLQLTQKTSLVKKNSVASMKQKIDATKFSKENIQVTSQNTSTGEEINRYLAKIQGHIYENFFPQLSTQGQSAHIIIKLAADGTVLDFRVVSYSANELFNSEIDRLKIRILRIKFPQNPDGKSGNYMIRLVAKE